MKRYIFENNKGQKTVINTDLMIVYYMEKLTLTVKLTGHELVIKFQTEEELIASYNHLDNFMAEQYPL